MHVGLALTVGTSSAAFAETQADGAKEGLEVIEVKGIRASTAAAINVKRFAASQVDGIAAEDIGKLPDVTIADSLQRITGVQVERTAGESGPVNIRGLPQAGVTFNGETFLSATTIDSSTVNLGDLPAQLFSGVDVYKSQQAKNSGQGIAGVIDLKTRRPFDMDDGWTYSGGAEYATGSISKESDGTLHGLINYNAGSKFGVLVALVTSDVTLATDYNGYNDTSENGGLGWTNNNHTWGEEPAKNADKNYIVPHGFTAFNKTEERARDAAQFSVQADLGEGFTLTADYFYTNQDRFNARRGFNHNSRWQTFSNYAYATGYTGDKFTAPDGKEWVGVNAFEMRPYRLQSFTQVNVNEETSHNLNLQLDFDNGGALKGQVRATKARATAKMRHGYGEGDILSIDQGTLVTGPGGFLPAEFCGPNDQIVGAKGGCFGSFSQGIQDSNFLITHNAAGEYPVFGGFDQLVNGGKGVRSVADYMADIDSYHIGAFSSEGNTDDRADLTTVSTKWNYALEDGFITSVDFGVRYSRRDVDHDQFTYTSTFGNGCDIAQWKAVDQNYNGATEGTPCYGVEGTGEYVDGTWTPYTLLNPTPLDQHASVSWQTNFGNVKGIPGVWSIDPENFRDPQAFHKRVFGNVARTENGGATYDVTLSEFNYFAQANFAYEDFSGNFGIKVIETDLSIKQNLAGPNLPHSGLGPDVGDVLTERSYTDYLPSFNAAYNATEEVILRAAYAKNVQPLDLATWGGGKTVGMVFNNDCNCMRVAGGTLLGNPQLEPWRSSNTSVSAEWYGNGATMAFISAFKIEIDSFTKSGKVMVDEADSDGVKRGPFEFDATVQGRGGKVEGIEVGGKLGVSDYFETNSFLDNFGVDVNYTYSTSEQETKDAFGRDLPFVGMSKDTYNFVVWYEQEEFSARLAWNQRSPRLMTQGSPATGYQSLYQDDYAQLDFNMTYNYSENLSVYFNGSNLTEEIQQTYVEFSGQKAFQNVYEARYTLGVRGTF